MALAVDWSPLVQAAVGAAGVGVTAVTGAMMAAAPQAFRALGAVLHDKRRTLVTLAVRTAAQNAVSSFQKGAVTMDAGVAAMLAYVRLNVGDTLKAMRLGDDTLHEMCSAEFAAVLTERQAAQAACPPTLPDGAPPEHALPGSASLGGLPLENVPLENVLLGNLPLGGLLSGSTPSGCASPGCAP